MRASQRVAQSKRRKSGGDGADGLENIEAVGAHKDRPTSLQNFCRCDMCCVLPAL